MDQVFWSHYLRPHVEVDLSFHTHIENEPELNHQEELGFLHLTPSYFPASPGTGHLGSWGESIHSAVPGVTTGGLMAHGKVRPLDGVAAQKLKGIAAALREGNDELAAHRMDRLLALVKDENVVFDQLPKHLRGKLRQAMNKASAAAPASK